MMPRTGSTSPQLVRPLSITHRYDLVTMQPRRIVMRMNMAAPDPTLPSTTHRRLIDGHMHIWQIDRLIEIASTMTVVQRPVSLLNDVLDEVCWFGGPALPTVRAVLAHARRVDVADLSHPIIISADGEIMDGIHRLAKADRDGHDTIDCVVFDVDPEPDAIDESSSA